MRWWTACGEGGERAAGADSAELTVVADHDQLCASEASRLVGAYVQVFTDDVEGALVPTSAL